MLKNTTPFISAPLIDNNALFSLTLLLCACVFVRAHTLYEYNKLLTSRRFFLLGSQHFAEKIKILPFIHSSKNGRYGGILCDLILYLTGNTGCFLLNSNTMFV